VGGDRERGLIDGSSLLQRLPTKIVAKETSMRFTLQLLPLALVAASPALADTTPPAPLPLSGTELDVSATASVVRQPDVATIGAGVVTQAARAGDALATNAAAMTRAIAALKHAGIADRDIQTQAVSVQPQYRYGDNQPPTLTGYQATNRVSVRSRDMGSVGRVIDVLVAAGANQIDGPTLSVEHPESALDEARAKAVAIARQRAELYARASGLSVRRIVRIAESDAAPPIVRPMPMMALRAKSEATPVEAGEQELSVTLSLVFALD
jgi:uncharacterized protein